MCAVLAQPEENEIEKPVAPHKIFSRRANVCTFALPEAKVSGLQPAAPHQNFLGKTGMIIVVDTGGATPQTRGDPETPMNSHLFNWQERCTRGYLHINIIAGYYS